MGKIKPSYIIIGAGHAGISAAENLRLIDQKINITLIDKDLDSFYYRAALKHFVKNHVSETQLAGRPADFLKINKIRYIQKNVVEINPNQQTITLEDGTIFPYFKLLLATGGRAFIPPIPGSDLEGVHSLRSLEDTRKICDTADNGQLKKCLILGGGVLGTELAEALSIRGLNAELFTNTDILMPKMIDSTCSELLTKIYLENGVKIHFNTSFIKIIDDGKGNAAGVETETGDKIEADGIFICTGIRKNIELAKLANLETNQGILVDQYLKTNDDNIFAAGDVAEYYDEGTKTYKLIELWGPAGDMGKIAAGNMLGGKLKYTINAFHAYTLLWDHSIHVIGDYNPSDANNYEIKEFNKKIAGIYNYFKLVFKDSFIVGAMSVGEARDPIIIQRIIAEKIPIPSDISKDEIMQRDFDYDRILFSK